MWALTFVSVVCLLPFSTSVTDDEVRNVMKDIKDHQGDINRLINHVIRGDGRRKAFERLQYMTDTFGHRFIGTEGLRNSIDYVKETLDNAGLDLVQLQPVQVRGWDRGEEKAWMTSPRYQPFNILALGFSVATPSGGIDADAIVVKSFDELKEKSDAGLTSGKIIVFNQAWDSYFSAVTYRVTGAVEAARAGGVACLVRSLTGLSLNTPHTGMQVYNDSVTKIPTASLTVEDAELLQRLQDKGETIRIHLEMTAQLKPDSTSFNVIAQINGTSYPEQVVMFGGHIDSWDVGAGVMDDAGGALISLQALLFAKQLGFQPKRTMRMVLWTSEEVDFGGANVYYESEKNKSDMFSLVMESDYGTFTPYGINFTGSELARAYMQEVLGLLESEKLNFLGTDQSGPDIRSWVNEAKVPGASLAIDTSKYFDYHHTRADMLTLQDPDDFDRCALVWCATAYVVADMDVMLPRTGDRPNFLPEYKPSPPPGLPGVGPVPKNHSPTIGGTVHYLVAILMGTWLFVAVQRS